MDFLGLSLQLRSAGHDDLFVCDDIFKRAVFTDVRILHDDGITDDRSLGHIDSSEQDGIDDGAFDLASVGDKRILTLLSSE